YLLDLTNGLARAQVTRVENLQERGEERWRGWNFLTAETNNSDLASAPARELLSQYATYWKLDLFYQAKDEEKGIFTPEALEEIRDFERRLRALEGYGDFCRKRYSFVSCDPAYTVTNIFFSVPNASSISGDTMQVIYDGSGSLANIEDMLKGFLRDGIDWWVDKDFGPKNLKSLYTRASFFGGLPLEGYESLDTRLEEQKAKSNDFLRKVWTDLLHRTDLPGDEGLHYEHVVFTWAESRVLYGHEVNFYLFNDLRFCIGTFILVSALILLRQQSLVTTFCGILGVPLAFSATYYFHYVVMGYQRMSVMDFVSIFLIVGIAADDILLLYNTYQLASAVVQLKGKTNQPAARMRWAYREAASAMLVTSVTTCVSFYANMLSIVSVVRQFGFFMGTLVLWNFLNVLTIFPASLLVNEMYLAPLWCCCRATKGPAPSSASCGEAEAVEMVQTASRLARQFSKDHDSHYVLHMQTEIQHDHLDCTERFMDRRFRPFLVTFRWLLLAFSFSLSGLCVFLAYTGFSLASGDIVIFEEDVNLGRVAALTSEIFPSYTSADLNNNLAILNPLQPQIKPSCPRLGDNNSWCSGLGSCDTFTGRCTCQEGYVGQACSVLRADPTLDFVPWPPPSIPKSYDYIHILARPSLLESPGTADATEPIYFLNQGDEPVEWSIEAPPESSSWLGLLQSSGAVPPRVFSRTDDAFPGRGGLMARYFVANRAAGFSEVVNLNLTSDLGTDTVRFSALVLQPPALSSLEVELLDLLDDVNVTPTLVPPFALDYGFSEVDGLNLARPGNTPLPSYRLDLPYAVPSIALSATLYSTAERAEYPPAVQLETEPAVNRIFLRVFSAFSADVSVVYTLEVVRASTTSTTTTSITTTFVARSIVSGELSIIVSDCMALSTDEVARRDLERGLGASLALPARQVEITDVRCTGTVRMEGSQRRVQSQAELVYEISLGGDANVSEVVTRIEQQTTASLTQELQSALDAGSSNLQLAVTSIGPVDQREGVTSTVTRTMTGTSTSRSSSSTTASFTSTSFTATSSMTLTVTQTTSTSTSRSTSSSTQSTSSSSTSTSSLTTTGGSTSSSSSSSSSRSFTSHTTSSTTSSTATFSSSTSSTVSTTGSLSSSTRTSSTRTTQTSTSGTETSQTSSTKTSSSLSSSSLSSTTSSISTSTISSSSTSTISITTTSRTTSSETSSSTSTRSTTSTSSTATTSSSSITHSSSTATTTSTGPDYIISGSISIELSNWTDEAVEEGLRNGIAEVAGVDPSWVRVTLPEPGEERRLSSSPMTVDYTIDLPPSLDMAAVAKVRTQIREEPLSSFGETLSDALDLAGAEVVLVLRAVETPWIEVETTPPPSTTSTTLFCPGEPVCGGLHGVCEATEEPSKPWQCSCSETYAGPSCAERVCPSCENNGTCSNESQDASGGNWACDCPAGFQGDRCELLRCPNDCSESGDCDTDTGVCSCFSGYSAVDCSLTPDWKVPLLNCIDIILTWGLKGHELDNASAPEFDPRFELLAAPETQAWLLETCQLARADLELLVRDELPCWIEGFETFVNAVGGMFPVEDPDLASQALQAFMHQDLAKKFYGDVVTDGVDYGGRLYFTMVRLKINVAQNANTTYRSAMRERWNDWVRRRNEGAPFRAGAMLMVSATWTQMQLESEVVQSTLLAFSASISVSLLAVAVFSQNVVIAIYVCMNILLVIGVLSGFLLNVMGYEFGVVEAIGATIFVGLSVDYCLHLAHAYNQAPGVNSKQKMRHALVVIGPSILGGALTTIMGSAFLLPCRILLFQKLGWTLFANSAVSMLFTFSFLSPMLLICGPVGRTGDLCCCLRRGGSLSDRWAEERHGTINLDQMTEESSAAAAFRAQAERRAGTLHLDSLESNVNAAADAFSAQARLKAGTIHLDALESRVSAAAAAFKEHGGGPRTDDRGSPSACVIGEVAGSPKAAVPSEPSSVSLFVPEEPSSVNLDPVVLGKSIRV
ncbi:unnamed protein product, partial [Durusdinium trenchii]